MANGMIYSQWGMLVPPKQATFKVASVLDTFCLDHVSQKSEHVRNLTQLFELYQDNFDGVFIFSILFHSHSGKVSHLRSWSISQTVSAVWAHIQPSHL